MISNNRLFAPDPSAMPWLVRFTFERGWYSLHTRLPDARALLVDQDTTRGAASGRLSLVGHLTPADVTWPPRTALALYDLHMVAFDKPLIALEPFGGKDTIAPAVQELADEMVPWDQRQLVDAIKRQARHEETTRFDVIEFKLD